MRSILSPALILAGTIIGAGIFGLPYAFSQAGFWGGFVLLAGLGIITFTLHLVYADIIVNIGGDHRLVGYANVIAGKWGAYGASAVNIFSLFGGLVAYLALGGAFLAALTGWNAATALSVIWVLYSAAILFGTLAFRRLEIPLTIAMIALIAAIFLFGVPDFSLRGSGSGFSGLFLLYGVGLFSFYGASALPEMKEYFGVEGNYSRRRIVAIVGLGTLLPALAYLIFVVGIWGLSGGAVSEDALSGIARSVPLQRIGFIIGILSCMTSYWPLSVNLKNLIRYDYHLGNFTGRAIVLFVPAIILLLVNASFLRLIEVIGSVAIGFEAALIIILHLMLGRRERKMPVITIPAFLAAAYIILFGFGIGYVFLA